MGKKDNFNQAFYEMFGVGKGGSAMQDGMDPEDLPDEELDLELEPKPETPAYEVKTGAPVQVPAAPVSAAPVSAPVDVRRMITYLAPGTVMEGTLRSKEDVEIAGDFKGDIISEGNVTVHSNIQGNITAASLRIMGCVLVGDCKVTHRVTMDKNSSANGNIVAGELVCLGKIKGDLNIQDNVTLDETASVEGDITTCTMTMAKGAMILGSLEMRAANN